VRTIIKLLIVISVVINPVALVADGLHGLPAQVESSMALANHQPSEVAQQRAASGNLISSECTRPCCRGGQCMLPPVPSCSLHHLPAFTADGNFSNDGATRNNPSFRLSERMQSLEVQPETPPPKLL